MIWTSWTHLDLFGLGLHLDSNSSGRRGDLHIKKIQSKLSFFAFRLAPILGKVSLDYRINLWKVLAKPLFKSGLGIMYANTKTRIKSLERVYKKFFKKFTGLNPRTSDCILSELVSWDISKLSNELSEMANARWSQRMFRCAKRIPRPKPKRTPLLPRNFVHYNNFQFVECKVCGRGSRGNANHSRTAHKVQVPTPIQVIQEMEVLFPRKAKGISRTSLLIAREAHINLYLRKLKDFMQTSDSHFSITK